MGKIRELANSLDASLHTVVGDDVPTALLDFARENNATQLVIGTSRRSRWARIFEEGIGPTIVERSGKIDVHMVTHEESKRGFRHSVARRPASGGSRRGWRPFIVPSVICAVTVTVLDPYLDTGGESALFFVGVLLVGSARRRCPGGPFGGAVRAAAELLPDRPAAQLHHRRTQQRHHRTGAAADRGRGRGPRRRRGQTHPGSPTRLPGSRTADAVRRLGAARRRSRDAARAGAGDLLTARGQHAARTQRGRARQRKKSYIVACVGKDPCVTVDSADTAIEVGDDEFWMLLAGRKLSARDRRVLSAVAKQAAGLIRQRELAEEASRAEAIVRADDLRRSLLSAVSHDLRTPLAAAKVAVSSLRAEDVAFSAEDTAELLATIEESIDQLTALVGNLLDSSRLAAGVIHPDLRRVYLEETVQRALVSIGKGATGFYRSAIDRVKVDVGDAVVMADAGLLERVLANLIDNALRYAPNWWFGSTRDGWAIAS